MWKLEGRCGEASQCLNGRVERPMGWAPRDDASSCKSEGRSLMV